MRAAVGRQSRFEPESLKADNRKKVDELLREAYGAALAEPVPQAMRSAIRGDDAAVTADIS